MSDQNPLNLSPEECVDLAIRQVEELLSKGVCTICALNLVAAETGADRSKLSLLYIEHVASVL